MVGARSHFWNGAFGAGFEFTIFEDGKGNPGVGEVSEIDADIALDGLGVDGVGQVPGLLALHHVDVFGRIKISATWARGIGGFDAVFTPEVGLADIVVIRNGDGRSVAHDIAELHTELKPAGGVLGVVIGLVSGKEEDVWVLRDEIFDDEGPRAGGAGGIAGKVADHDGFLVVGLTADFAFKGSLVGVAEAVCIVLCAVPIVNAEVGGPTGIDDLLFGDFLPAVALLDLEADILGLVRLEGVELRGHFQRTSFERINCEANDLVPRNIEVDHGLALILWSLSLPPFAGGAVVETSVFCSEDLGRGGHEFSAGGEDKSGCQKSGQKLFHGGKANNYRIG